MRDYGKVHTSFWTSPNIGALSEDGKNLALYLLTCPHGTISGVFRLPNGYACEDLKWAPERIDASFNELLNTGFARRCETTKWVWVIKHFEWNLPENPNQKKAAIKIIQQIPDACTWKADFMTHCAHFLYTRSASPKKAAQSDFETLSERFGKGFETVPEPFCNPSLTSSSNSKQEQLNQKDRLSGGGTPARGIVHAQSNRDHMAHDHEKEKQECNVTVTPPRIETEAEAEVNADADAETNTKAELHPKDTLSGSGTPVLETVHENAVHITTHAAVNSIAKDLSHVAMDGVAENSTQSSTSSSISTSTHATHVTAHVTHTTRIAAIARLLRQHGAKVFSDSPQLGDWAKQDVSDAALLAALTFAKQRRIEQNSTQPINLGFLNTILIEEILAKSARHEHKQTRHQTYSQPRSQSYPTHTKRSIHDERARTIAILTGGASDDETTGRIFEGSATHFMD